MTFCVKPNSTSSCLEEECQMCETLQYYLENVNTTINQHANVTLLLLSGTHDISNRPPGVSYIITAPFVSMVGADEHVNVVGACSHGATNMTSLFFFEVQSNIEDLQLENVNFKFFSSPRTVLRACSFQNTSLIFSLSTMLAENCMFQYSGGRILLDIHSEAIMRDSSFLTGFTILSTSSRSLFEDCQVRDTDLQFIYNSTALVSGNSQLDGCSFKSFRSDVLVSGNTQLDGCSFLSTTSNITLSGMISVMNGKELRGGGIALYSDSSLNFETGANVSFINNSALDSGGALYMSSSSFNIATGVVVNFVNNSAQTKGGAIYIGPGNVKIFDDHCFYRVASCESSRLSQMYFANNSAEYGGDDIYGGLTDPCYHGNHPECKMYTVMFSGLYSSISSVSSDPEHVCFCDEYGAPRCYRRDYSYLSFAVRPGESFTFPVVLVGVNYNGTTTGVLYTYYTNTYVGLDFLSQTGHVISDSKQCTNVSYTLFSDHAPESVKLYLSPLYMGADSQGIYKMEIYLNITLLPCPAGFTLLNQRCDCFLRDDLFDNCSIVSGRGYFSWSKNVWVNLHGNATIIYNKNCPFDYCNKTYAKPIDLERYPDSQCAFNRAGRLCGGCKENYSLAIGSSHCVHCPNNNNLALLIFFAAAGFLLVFFISALNLTVTQGMINGLIFYANIVWTYQSIFFAQDQEELVFLKTFVAWINLDFGIETCFFDGLNAFTKTWLQFIFPFYIWTIAGLIIVAAKYSTRLTNLLGNRAVPVLDTLFLLSYMKLLRMGTSSLGVSTVIEYPQGTTSLVWAVDGNLSYFGSPHIFLFLVGLATLLFLWLPYTLLLFLMQWLRRLNHLSWMMRYQPVFDAYFAPLKDKHQYWFGVQLLARGFLLVSFASVVAIQKTINLLLLQILVIALLFYMITAQPYKRREIAILYTSFLANLAFLSGFKIFALTQVESIEQRLKTIAIGLSAGVAFVQFCGIVLVALITTISSVCKKTVYNKCDKNEVERSIDFSINHHRDHLAETCEREPLLSVCKEDAAVTY